MIRVDEHHDACPPAGSRLEMIEPVLESARVTAIQWPDHPTRIDATAGGRVESMRRRRSQ